MSVSFNYIRDIFVKTAIVILSVTMAAKLWTFVDFPPLMRKPDPVLSPFRIWQTIGLAAFVEAAALAYIWLNKRPALQLAALAWVTTIFAVYRLLWIMSGAKGLCSCLGSLTETIPLEPKTLDIIMTMAFFYLWIGSFTLLVCSKRISTADSVSCSIKILPRSLGN